MPLEKDEEDVSGRKGSDAAETFLVVNEAGPMSVIGLGCVKTRRRATTIE
jgi:hypothetical protein